MNNVMERLRGSPDCFEDPMLRNAVRTDYLYDDTGLPQSNVISFSLSDSDRFIVRPSGTEPKLKAYLFTNAGSESEAEQRLNRIQSIVDRLCK